MVIELIDAVELEISANGEMIFITTRNGDQLAIHQPFHLAAPTIEEKNNMPLGREFCMKIFFTSENGQQRCIHLAKFPQN